MHQQDRNVVKAAALQVVEGLDSMLRMPGGCFEQTSSSTYPNVLVMDYLKTSKKLTPEIQAKAEGFISLGYQRLVTFEDGGKKAFVELPGKNPKDEPKKVEISTGISDGLNIEVTKGLKKGDQVVQRPPKTIS